MYYMIGSALFWAHLIVIVFALSVGVLFPLPIAIGLIAMHRLHAWLFNGCLLTKIEQRVGSLPPGVDFLQHLAEKFSGSSISRLQSRALDYGLASIALSVAVANHFVAV